MGQNGGGQNGTKWRVGPEWRSGAGPGALLWGPGGGGDAGAPRLARPRAYDCHWRGAWVGVSAYRRGAGSHSLRGHVGLTPRGARHQRERAWETPSVTRSGARWRVPRPTSVLGVAAMPRRGSGERGGRMASANVGVRRSRPDRVRPPSGRSPSGGNLAERGIHLALHSCLRSSWRRRRRSQHTR